MPEAENPDLYKRLRQLLDSARERRPGGSPAIGLGALTTPEAGHEAAMRFGRGLVALFEKAQREAAEFERMSESQRAAIKAAADAEAEENLAFGKAYAARLNALVDEYNKDAVSPDAQVLSWPVSFLRGGHGLKVKGRSPIADPAPTKPAVVLAEPPTHCRP
jgi:hypothetical protein